MKNIFEELMASNRELTNQSKKTEIKEGRKPVKVSLKNLKVESMKIFEEEELSDLDDQFAVEPEDAEEKEDEVVLVIDPEIPADEEVPEEAAEDLVGCDIYKCPICGANYVCHCDENGVTEDIEVDEDGVPTECPVCGDDADQILIGEIAPVEGAGEETELEPVDNDEEAADDEAEEIDDAAEEIADDEIDIENTVDKVEDDLEFDEEKFESLMNRMMRENYRGDTSFKVKRVASKGSKLKIEYIVRSGKKQAKGIMIAEGFNPKARNTILKIRDKGQFTESFTKTPSFIIECVKTGNKITAKSVRYNFKTKMNESLYRVHGQVGKINRARINEGRVHSHSVNHQRPAVNRRRVAESRRASRNFTKATRR